MVQKLTSGSFNIVIFLTLKRSFWAGPAERTEEARASSAAASRVAAGAAAARRRHFPLSPSRPASFREEAGTGAARTVPATGGAGEGRGPTMQPERGGSRPRREGGRHGRRRPGGAEKAAEPATESGGADGHGRGGTGGRGRGGAHGHRGGGGRGKREPRGRGAAPLTAPHHQRRVRRRRRRARPPRHGSGGRRSRARRGPARGEWRRCGPSLRSVAALFVRCSSCVAGWWFSDRIHLWFCAGKCTSLLRSIRVQTEMRNC